jgi:hypothetical protein
VQKHIAQECGDKHRQEKPNDGQPIGSHPVSGIDRGGRDRVRVDLGQSRESPTRFATGRATHGRVGPLWELNQTAIKSGSRSVGSNDPAS